MLSFNSFVKCSLCSVKFICMLIKMISIQSTSGADPASKVGGGAISVIFGSQVT